MVRCMYMYKRKFVKCVKEAGLLYRSVDLTAAVCLQCVCTSIFN